MLCTSREVAAVLRCSGLLELLPTSTLHEVLKLYEEGVRHYHDFDHISETLSWLNCVLEVFPESDLAPYTALELRLAALFHDIVYTPAGSPTNEVQSCELFREMIGDLVLAESADRVCELVMFTAKHGKLEASDVPLAGQLLLDADIVSLAQYRWEVFQYNNQNVIEELKLKYPVEEISAGRKAFFGSMLAKKSIFLSDWFRLRCEEQARRNLIRASAELEDAAG